VESDQESVSGGPAEKPATTKAAGSNTGALSVSTANLISHYCNVTTANSTREEVVLSFGVNQNWDRSRTDLAVSLLHRIILSPQHAKRLHQSLSAQLADYEQRYGPLQG
jgi:hypothetical protein